MDLTRFVDDPNWRHILLLEWILVHVISKARRIWGRGLGRLSLRRLERDAVASPSFRKRFPRRFPSSPDVIRLEDFGLGRMGCTRTPFAFPCVPIYFAILHRQMLQSRKASHNKELMRFRAENPRGLRARTSSGSWLYDGILQRGMAGPEARTKLLPRVMNNYNDALKARA